MPGSKTPVRGPPRGTDRISSVMTLQPGPQALPVRRPLGPGRTRADRLAHRAAEDLPQHRPQASRPARSHERDPLRQPHRHRLALPSARLPRPHHRLLLLHHLDRRRNHRTTRRPPPPPGPRPRANRLRHRLTIRQDAHTVPLNTQDIDAARRSWAANAASPSTHSACYSWSWSPRPASRTTRPANSS